MKLFIPSPQRDSHTPMIGLLIEGHRVTLPGQVIVVNHIEDHSQGVVHAALRVTIVIDVSAIEFEEPYETAYRG